ncbi:MAG: serine--tRNA ligase [Chlamydiia bacterium]
MLDIKLIRKDPALVQERLQLKDPAINLKPLIEADSEWQAITPKLESLRAEKNRLAKEVGVKKSSGGDTTEEMNRMAEIKSEESDLSKTQAGLEETIQSLLSELPNLPFNDIPFGKSAADNVEIHHFQEKKELGFPFKHHVELSDNLGLFDFEKGAKISGRGFPVYNHAASKIEMALWNLMLETHQKHGFNIRMLPLLVRKETMYASGQLPKFENQLFKIKDDDFNLYLIPTSEVPLNSLYRDEIIEEKDLPILLTSLTPCFRREAGAAGSNERGLIRTHQFYKVELFALTTPHTSPEVHQKMIDSAHEVLESLQLHYRDMLLCSQDMSFAAAKTIDIEVWLHGQNRYYEVSSASNCSCYQARRSNIRYRKKDGTLDFVHTLNASGLATSRLMVALLETNQQPDGSIDLPETLAKRVGFKVIRADGTTT